MKVSLQYALSDPQVAPGQPNQRQLITTLRVETEPEDTYRPLNLAIILDRSASVAPSVFATLKQALLTLATQLTPQDRLTLVTFNHCAELRLRPPGETATTAATATTDHWLSLGEALRGLKPEGGTCLNEALRLGISELVKHQNDRISHVMLITDGSNDHGSDRRCLKLAEFLAEKRISLQVVGLGLETGETDLLQQLVEVGQGTLKRVNQTGQLQALLKDQLTQLQSLRCLDTVLYWIPEAGVQLAQQQPWAQVAPEVCDLDPEITPERVTLRLGTLVTYSPRVLLTNLYITASQPGLHRVAKMQVHYRHPLETTQRRSAPVLITATATPNHTATLAPAVRPHLLNLTKYRQVALAEARIEAGDAAGAAHMLYAAAVTAQELGNVQVEQVLGHQADRLRNGSNLSGQERHVLRILAQSVV
ncbi:MAG: vWA domain-containing protein [Prochlorothrix sp.]